MLTLSNFNVYYIDRSLNCYYYIMAYIVIETFVKKLLNT